MLTLGLWGRAQDAAPSSDPPNWNLHLQSTVIAQGHPSFPADYSGPNSMKPGDEIKDTVSVDVIGGARLWHGGELDADILIWQGFGLSNTLGAAAFPSGEAYRIGKTYPDSSLARVYLRETVGMGGPKHARRLTLAVGRFSAKDFFDSNAYANDARTQFMNWALVANPAWDYPANTLGFTNGVAVEFKDSRWAGRLGVFQVSGVQNGVRMDWNVAQAHSAALEFDRRYGPAGRAGVVRLLAFHERAHMRSYQDMLNNPALAQSTQPTPGYRSKYGFGINSEQEVRKDLGVFMRLGWSDGRNETWEFTDVDRSASAGISLKGERWRRPADTAALGLVVSGISAAHRQFLAAGGKGITVGDGALNYRSERFGETYYNWGLSKHFQLTLDYQFAKNPAYNHARGPVHIIATRLHTEF